MDIASVIGLTVAIGSILLGHLLHGGSLDMLLQPAAFVIVVGGTTGAVLLQVNIHTFLHGVQMLRWVFRPPKHDLLPLIEDIKRWAMTGKREGLVKLESLMKETDDRFIQRGLQLIVDGTPPPKLKEILEIELSNFERFERQSIKIWEAAAGYSPTMGILGAVFGLIHAMGTLADPSKIGSGIAVAFVATIYGVGLANLFLLPISNKLRALNVQELSKREMLLDAFVSIASGENRRVLEDHIAAYLKHS
jgi:chemotaxis protein MotA